MVQTKVFVPILHLFQSTSKPKQDPNNPSRFKHNNSSNQTNHVEILSPDPQMTGDKMTSDTPVSIMYHIFSRISPQHRERQTLCLKKYILWITLAEIPTLWTSRRAAIHTPRNVLCQDVPLTAWRAFTKPATLTLIQWYCLEEQKFHPSPTKLRLRHWKRKELYQ